MKPEILRLLRERLQRERRELVNAVGSNLAASRSISEAPSKEFEEQSQLQRDAFALEPLTAIERSRVDAIDAALERMDAGAFNRCARCGSAIEDDRLIADPTATLCIDCSRKEAESTARPPEESELVPPSGRLPPDLAVLDDEELQEHLWDLLRQDGRIDAQEVQIIARNGVVYLEGALPSEPEHQMLLNILTDIAGIQEIVDHLEIQRLAWERSERSATTPGENEPTRYPDREPYGGTEDVNLTDEEGVAYDPPDNPPPPYRKD